jgi:hypothetical protein
MAQLRPLGKTGRGPMIDGVEAVEFISELATQLGISKQETAKIGL